LAEVVDAKMADANYSDAPPAYEDNYGNCSQQTVVAGAASSWRSAIPHNEKVRTVIIVYIYKAATTPKKSHKCANNQCMQDTFRHKYS